MFIPYHTRNFDDTAKRIKKLVAVLDKHWFQDKKKEFEKLCEEGSDYYIIDHTPENYQEYLQSLTPEERFNSNDNFIEEVHIDKFCFYADYSGNPVCGKSVADKIVVTTKDISIDSDVNHKYEEFIALISDVKAWIDEEVNENIDYYKNEEYNTIVRGIVNKIKWEIDYRFNNKLKALERKHNKAKLKDLEPVRNSKKVKTTRSYKWLGKPEDLNELYRKMKDFFSGETKFVDFKNIFSNKEISIINPIKWHDDTASELLYFIMQLVENGLIEGKRLNYLTLTGCFLKSDGKKFTANFKNLKQSIPIKLTLAKMAKIEAIVKSFT